MISVATIAERYNALAPSEGPRLLPNGFKCGTKWMFSGVPDTGLSASAWLNLSGPNVGHWIDAGNCAAGEDKGDLLDLLALKHFHGDRRAGIQEAKRIVGIDDAPQSERQREVTAEDKARRLAAAEAALAERARKDELDRLGRVRSARALWLNGRPIAGTPAEAYLIARQIRSNDRPWPATLRYHPDLSHVPSHGRYPALLAGGFGAAGGQQFVHRIWLARRGGVWDRIDDTPKMALGPVWGNFIPINKGASGKPMSAMPEDEPIYVTEGIEDALVVRMLRPQFRIIAAVNLGNIGALALPERARRLVIVADRDENPAAQDALERAIAQQQAQGREVHIVVPPPPHKDVNDWLRGRGRREAAA
jgi:hypothetical protein